jgi:di/tripeptidase
MNTLQRLQVVYNRCVAFATSEVVAAIRVIGNTSIDQIGHDRRNNNARMAHVVTAVVSVRVDDRYYKHAIRPVPFVVRYDVFTEVR